MCMSAYWLSLLWKKCDNITNESICQKELKTIFVNIFTP